MCCHEILHLMIKTKQFHQDMFVADQDGSLFVYVCAFSYFQMYVQYSYTHIDIAIFQCKAVINS